MTTFSELKSKADVLVADPSLTDYLGDFINQGVSEIAGGMLSLLDGIENPIPNALTTATSVDLMVLVNSVHLTSTPTLENILPTFLVPIPPLLPSNVMFVALLLLSSILPVKI